MADIKPVETLLNRCAEYERVSVTFTPILDENESLVSIKIVSWDENEGIKVNGNNFSGEYINTFDYGNDRLLVRKGDVKTHLDSWESLTQPSKTDVYCWKAPITSRLYTYNVIMHYTVKTEPDGGSRNTSQETLEKIYTQEVYPNWDFYADKLKKNIAIRRLTWLE